MGKTLLVIAAIAVVSTTENLLAQNPGFLTNGLVGYYQFSGNADDSTGNGNNGTANNIAFATDRFSFANSAASFVGNLPSYIDVSTMNFDLNPPFSVSVWISYNNSSRGGPRIFSTSGYEMALGDSGQGPTTPINLDGIGPGLTSTNVVRAGVWSHVVGVWTTNGIASGSTASSFPPVDYSRWPFARIGGNSGKTSDDNYGGLIDDLRIYNRELSADEVAALYDAEAPIVGIILLPTVTVRGVPGKSYSLQDAESFDSTNWTTLVSNITFLTNGVYLYPDTNSLNQPKRFYRALVQ